jgi:hypothetical protein
VTINLFQRINVTATFAVLSANGLGVTRTVTNAELSPQNIDVYNLLTTNWKPLAIAIFSIILRLKVSFDDHDYFKERLHGAHDYFTLAGFVIGVISWTTWIISGSLAFIPQYAATWLGITILILTLWLVVHILELSPGCRVRHQA